jgi:hypothetical protein
MWRHRFSLRALFLFVSVISAILATGYYVIEVRPREQERIVSVITLAKGTVHYDFELHPKTLFIRCKAPLAKLLGRDAVGGVRHVSLIGCQNPEELAAVLREASRLRSVDDLWLQGSHIDDACVEAISRIQGLETLFLAGSRPRVPSLRALRELPHLEVLSLRHTKGLTESILAEVAQLPRLKELELSLSDISDGGLRELARCPELRRLDISITEITPEGFKALVGCSTLRTLLVDHTQEETARKILGHLEIVVQY